MARITPGRTAVLVTLLVIAFTGWSLYTLQPLAPASASAPAREFSAARAMKDTEVVARTAHPTGSAGAAEVRGHLERRLASLGGTVSVETATVAVNGEGTAKVGEVSNVFARFPGSGPTGTVLLVAHYDSVPAGPGAADNGVNVAAVLEVVRALREDGPTRNTVEVLFTDGEEAGLLGAHDFVAKKVADPANTVVLNLEARGVSGPSIMFESGRRNSGVLPALDGAERPVATSLADEIYRLMSNHTDFSEFKEAGFTGLNFAFVDGSARYHTTGDAVANVDRASLQHQGDSVLAAARALSGEALGSLDGGDDTYFTFLGFLVHYAQSLVLVLAGLAVLASAATVWYARRTGALSGGSVKGALGFFGALAVSWVTAFCLWSLAVLIRPQYENLLMGDTYRPEWYRAAFLAFGFAAVLGWYQLLRRRIPVLALTLGAWGWFAFLALLTAVLAPGAAYLFTWPLLIGCAGLAAALRWGGRDSAWHAVGASAAALPAVLLFLPVITLIFPTLGISAAPVPLVLCAFVTVLLAPLAAALPRRAPGLTALVAATAGAALLLTGMKADGFAPDRPAHTSLAYLWDADRSQGTWATSDATPPAWTRKVTGPERGPVADRFPTFPPVMPYAAHTAAAAGPGPAAPAATVSTENATATERTVRLKVTPAPGTSYITLMADVTRHTVEEASLLGVTVDGGVNRPFAEGPWKWGFVLWSVPEDGVEITLKVSGEGEVPLWLTGYTAGLPQSPALPPMPAHLTWSTHGDALTNVTAAGRGIRA
ncbi:M20/M25/M40 family metallo-hydrolase [Streptomyces antarcticus]|uniref:M20/M25/M40 family metallo-hydrolase n=1 Tax=Streptomyces antarcticus TaxID=2996458 RepID=UPI0022AEA0B5|nr:M20/M25/M40 family metallo-hydrolase [Streptomyces sp. H34-S5]MCZ4087643.1 M20/M25/M40 family metallo-hydrolase [Streptomyces sp. H34-S5]